MSEQESQSIEWRRKSEILSKQVADLECDNARLVEEFIHSTQDKDAKLKEQNLINAQLKTELRSAHLRIKEFECEVARIRNELDQEKNKKSDAEASNRNESLLRQSYDRVSVNLKSQKEHMDQLMASQ
jgi:hypothetical protein